MFRESLQKMIDRLDGGMAGILIGFDGISVDSYTRPNDGTDIQTVGMELAHLVTLIRKTATHQLEVGGLHEITMSTEKAVVLVRTISDEYFVACVVRPDANFGKARYLMRLMVPQIQADL